MYAENAEKLAPLCSTQANESFNNMVAAKATKIDITLVQSVFQSWSGCLSKTHWPELPFGSRLVKEANKRKCRVSSKAYQVRRLELNSKRKLVDNTLEVRGGDTYESGITFSEGLDTLSIPAPVAAPSIEKCPISEYCFISFDVETTSLADNNEIVQLSAVNIDSYYNSYVLPKKIKFQLFYQM